MSDLLSPNRVKTQSVARLDGIRIHASNFTVRRNAPRHVHQDYVFGLLVEGAMEIDCGHCGETHVLEPGNLLLTEAHEVYATRSLGKPPWRYFSIGFSKERIISILGLLTDGNQITLPHFTGGAIKNRNLREDFVNLYDALIDERPALEQETLLLDWVASVYENYSDSTDRLHNRRIYSESEKIRRVREYIRQNLAENIKLETLAEVAQISPFHLNRTFSAQVGLPPHEFQNQLRVETAARLIAQKKSLAEIALETGFSDQSHFTRFFKRYTGVTPKNFYAR